MGSSFISYQDDKFAITVKSADKGCYTYFLWIFVKKPVNYFMKGKNWTGIPLLQGLRKGLSLAVVLARAEAARLVCWER